MRRQRELTAQALITVCVLVGAVLASMAASAQATHEPHAKDATPTPRLPDGTVDLGGKGVWDLWWVKNFADYLVDREEIPFLPWTQAMYDYNASNDVAYDPEGFCLPPGGPRAFGTPYPAEFLQQDDRIVVIFEGGAHVWREIHMDGRPHPEGDALNPTYFGHSVGRWEGDVLVVDTVGYNEKTWLDFGGHMHTDKLHTIERISRPNREILHYETTIIDPGAYSEPWTIAWDIPWSEGQELAEYICQENNRFLIDLKDDFGNPFFAPTEGAR
jgi:hypothetical protein